jgi:hypothetical protein
MKREKKYIAVGLGTILTIIVGTGCISHHRAYTPVVVAPAPTGEVVVTEAPPPPRQEVVTVAPSSAHVWVGGYWLNRRGHWAWIPGHYEIRPRPGVVWVQGHWDRTSAGWVWTPGRWQ